MLPRSGAGPVGLISGHGSAVRSGSLSFFPKRSVIFLYVDETDEEFELDVDEEEGEKLLSWCLWGIAGSGDFLASSPVGLDRGGMSSGSVGVSSTSQVSCLIRSTRELSVFCSFFLLLGSYLKQIL